MNNKGFTLVELIVVVIVLAIMASIALPMYTKALERSRAGGAISILTSLAKAESSFRMMVGYYTNNISNLDITIRDSATQADATGNTFEDPYFTFTIEDDANNPVTVATRKDKSEDETYTLTVNYEQGNVVCAPSDYYVCKYLGL